MDATVRNGIHLLPVREGAGLSRFLLDVNAILALLDPMHVVALAHHHGARLATFDRRIPAEAVVGGTNALAVIDA